jgi:polyphosphate glucokinase
VTASPRVNSSAERRPERTVAAPAVAKPTKLARSGTQGGAKGDTSSLKAGSAAMQQASADAAREASAETVLVVDVGGNSVKILATGQTEPRSIRSGPTLTASQMVSGVKRLAAGWTYDVVSIGYPGPVLAGRPLVEPRNLGRGWVGFNFARAFGCPVKLVNDAAMQALGSYKGGKMLFLGLGTGLGTAMIVEGIIAPMEVSHLPYKRGTYERYLGRIGLKRYGKKRWRRHVADVVGRLVAALQPDDTVIGGGNAKKLKALPSDCRQGTNANAFRGGFRLWADDSVAPPDLPPPPLARRQKRRAKATSMPARRRARAGARAPSSRRRAVRSGTRPEA